MSEALFGSLPKVPALEKLSLGKEQAKAAADNIAIAPEASKLANLTTEQIMSMLEKVDPGFAGKTSKISGNIDDLLAGKIPQDVSDAVQRNSATRSLTGGFSGSEMSRNLTARDLGITSLDLTAKGLSSAESWLAATERLLSPAMAVYTNMFVTPGQEYAADNEQNLQQFQVQWMKEQISALPDPVIRGTQDTFMQLSGRGGQPNTGMDYGKLASPGRDGVSSSGNMDAFGWQTAESDMFDSGFNYGNGAGAGSGASSGADSMVGSGIEAGAITGIK